MKVLAAAVLLALAWMADDPSQAWPQWGGPARDFSAPEVPLATAWPSTGPPQLWRRRLGDGFGGIVSDSETLYTVYRDGADDVAVALSAKDGRTVWESRYAAPFTETCSERLGPAPRAAPLIAGDRLVTVTAGGDMHSLDRKTGRRVWSVTLVPDGSDNSLPCGYSSSPVAYKDTIITTAGGKGRGVMAVAAADGRVRWATQDFGNGYSSPTLIQVDGAPHLVTFTAGEVSGLDPGTGTLEWSVPHPAEFGVNVAMPIAGRDNVLFLSSAYNGGSRALKLSRAGGKVRAEELWAHKRVRIHFGNAVRIGDLVFGSSGDFGAAPLAAIDVRTGEMPWRDRRIGRASLIASGRRLIVLDENGTLTLATPGADALEVHAQAQVLKQRSWTAPTLCGTRLYVRDREEIAAFELGAR